MKIVCCLPFGSTAQTGTFRGYCAAADARDDDCDDAAGVGGTVPCGQRISFGADNGPEAEGVPAAAVPPPSGEAARS